MFVELKRNDHVHFLIVVNSFKETRRVQMGCLFVQIAAGNSKKEQLSVQIAVIV
jgi:hypothetical protein